MSRLFTLLLLFSAYFLSAQDNYERMKYAIEHNNWGRVHQLLEMEGKNREVMEAWSFKMAVQYDKQLIMRKLYEGEPSIDAVWFNTVVEYYWNENRLPETEYWGLRALDLLRKQVGDTHEEYGIGLRILGLLYWKKGEMGSSEKYLRAAHEVFTQALGPQHARTLEVEKTIGALFK